MCGKQTQRNVAWCGLHPFGTDLCTQHCTSTALYCAALYCAVLCTINCTPQRPIAAQNDDNDDNTHTHTHTHTHTPDTKTTPKRRQF